MNNNTATNTATCPTVRKMCIRDRAPAAANGGSKKYYSLTHKGKEVLEELIEFWANYESCVNGFIATYQQAEVS